MKQELLDKIKEQYEDYSKMVKTDFEEAKEKSITEERKKKIKWIENICYYEEQAGKTTDDTILEEAIASVIRDEKDEIDLGKTNKILMYISEMQYGTYQKLLGVKFKGINPKEIYVLYMDIESKEKYFIKKDVQEEFEKRHKVIVTYKNPNCSNGMNYERNYYGIQFIRRNFIKEAMYSGQEEATKQLVKKYQG